jgi:hypothetical protein
MKKLLALLLLFGIAGCEKGLDSSGSTPLCNETIKGKFGYFDNCRTVKYEWQKGNYYSGNWKNNKFHGKLGFTSTSNSNSSGEWIDGKRNGLHYTYIDGAGAILTRYAMGETLTNDFIAHNQSSSSTSSYIPQDSSTSTSTSALIGLGNSVMNSKPATSTKEYTPLKRKTGNITTVNSNQLCPLLASPLIKQEVSGNKRFCYYQ